LPGASAWPASVPGGHLRPAVASARPESGALPGTLPGSADVSAAEPHLQALSCRWVMSLEHARNKRDNARELDRQVLAGQPFPDSRQVAAELDEYLRCPAAGVAD
jgi:hypothetical protein